MNFNDDKEDFFDEEIVNKEKKVKEPEYSPEDPRYWEQPESEFEHLRPLDPRRRDKWKVWLIVTGVVVVLAVIGYIYYFTPYVEESTQYGYVENIERRGTLFKTYEGVILPYREIMDTTRVYREDFVFTAVPEVAAKLRRMLYANMPVRVVYNKYHTTLPWRGDSKIVVTRVDSVDPAKILPPEFKPEILRDVR